MTPVTTHTTNSDYAGIPVVTALWDTVYNGWCVLLDGEKVRTRHDTPRIFKSLDALSWFVSMHYAGSLEGWARLEVILDTDPPLLREISHDSAEAAQPETHRFTGHGV